MKKTILMTFILLSSCATDTGVGIASIDMYKVKVEYGPLGIKKEAARNKAVAEMYDYCNFYRKTYSIVEETSLESGVLFIFTCERIREKLI